jgi:hypothetical protein
MKNKLKILLLFVFFISCFNVQAQRKKNNKKNIGTKKSTVKSALVSTGVTLDTTKPNVLTITSTFKPFLKAASKINFTASMPILDTTKLSLAYSIPAQNLMFTYQPVPIKPIAYTNTINNNFINSNYIKMGFGNYALPYAEAGLSFGSNQTTLYTIFAKYHQAKGSILYQESTQAQLKINADFNTIKTHDLVASISYKLSAQNKYGTNPNFVFTKDQLKQNFNTIDAAVQLHSKQTSEYGISYHPNLSTSLFSDDKQTNETSIVLDAPFEKYVSKNISIGIGFLANISFYKNNNTSISNHVFAIQPKIQFANQDVKVKVGVQPTWNNSELEILPDIAAEYYLAKEKFIVLGGVKSFIQKNTYQSLAAINPYIDQPNIFLNSKTNEIFAGLKGAVGKHFSFMGKLSFNKTANQVLFANDTANNKSQNFNILYEPDLKSIKISGEISYIDKEKFSLVSGIVFTQFTSQEKFERAFGLLPFEINSSIKYHIFKDVIVKSDLYIWDGAQYRLKNNITGKSKMAVDLNIGTEIKILKNTNFYLDFNNLFNSEYQRWNQYNVFGFNVVAGVVYSFH